MSTRLWRLIYVSRSRDALSITEMLDLEHRSHRHNALSETTGMLLFDGEEFIQAIEGPEDAVRATLGRILRDPRHDQIVVAVDGPTLSRQFRSWAMKCRHVSRDGAGMRELVHDLSGITDPDVLALFMGFTRRGQARASARANGRNATAETRALDVHLGLILGQAQAALNQAQALRTSQPSTSS